MNDTIFALSSGQGTAGVAVIRISGQGAGRILSALAGGLPRPRHAALRTLRDRAGAVLDAGLVLWFPAPASFTGEDVAELHVHGGRAVIAHLHEVLAGFDGVRPAEAGEFTRRAFDHGKLDLTEVEGIADLIQAQTQAQRRQALRQMRGQAGRRLEAWRAALLQALALMEAELDFSDEEDVPGDSFAAGRAAIAALADEIGAALERGISGERLREGVRAVIAGPPNAGKSSLLNALAGRDAAIVSATAGTTRDVIEVHMELGGLPVTLVDTAGLRDSEDAVEQEGVRRSRAAMSDADMIVWLEAPDVEAADPAMSAPEMPDPALPAAAVPVLKVASKSDLGSGAPDALPVSAHTGAGIDALTEEITAQARLLCAAGETALVTRARHRDALKACSAALARFLEGPAMALELQAEELRLAAHALGRITGRVDVEDILDIVFSDFCIGK